MQGFYQHTKSHFIFFINTLSKLRNNRHVDRKLRVCKGYKQILNMETNMRVIFRML